MTSSNLIFSDQRPTFLCLPGFINREEKFEEPLTGVSHIYSLALILGSDFPEGSLAFRYHANAEPASDMLWLFWLMTLAVEDKENGATFISTGKGRGLIYEGVVNAIARKKCGQETRRDINLIKREVKPHFYFDLQQQQDIRDAIILLQEKDIEKQKKTLQREEKQKEKEKPKGFVPPPGTLIGIKLSIRYNKLVSDEVPGQPDLPAKFLDPYGVTSCGLEPSFDLRDEEDNLFSEEFLAASRDNLVSKAPLPKVKMLVTPVPSAVEPDTRVGYMIQFVVFDPTWNPGKTFNKMANETLLPHLFPNYDDCPTQIFPTKNFTLHKYTRVVTSLLNIGITNETFAEWYGVTDFADYNSQLHIKHLLTLRFALDRLRNAGADEAVLQSIKESFPRDPIAGETVEILPFSLVESFAYPPAHIRWYHPDYIGLYEQYFPGLDIPDHTQIDETDKPSPLRALAERPFVSIKEIYQIMPEFASGRGGANELYVLKSEADVLVGRLKQREPDHRLASFKKFHSLFLQHGDDWRDYVELADEDELEAYEAYDTKCKEVKNRCMIKFADSWRLDGGVHSVQITKDLKQCLYWYVQYAEENPYFSREQLLRDPNMTFFGNMMAKEANLLQDVRLLDQPAMTILTQGLFSGLNMDKSLKLHLLIFGEAGTGKSRHFIDENKRGLMIPGTLHSEDFVSDKADTSEHHMDVGIRMRDEVPNHFFCAKAAAARPDLVNRIKTQWAEGVITSKIFAFQTDRQGNQRRGYEEYSTRTNYSTLGLTNGTNGPNNPIKDRAVPITMKKTKGIRRTETADNESAICTRNTRLYFQRFHFCSATVNQAMNTFAICNKVEDELWTLLTARFEQTFMNWGCIQIPKRSFPKMYNAAREHVIRRAACLTWDVPGSPYYRKPFSLDQLIYMQRYLYFTEEIVLFTFTQFAELIIDRDAGNVYRAIMRLLNIPEKSYKASPYELYKTNVNKTILFKTTRTHSETTNKFNVDLNYFEFKQSKLDLAAELVTHTDPELPADHIAAVLDRLSTDAIFTPRHGANNRNGYAPIGNDTLAQHRFGQRYKVQADKARLEIQLPAFAQYYALKHRRTVLQRIVDIDPLSIQTIDGLMNTATKHNLLDTDTVLLYLMGPSEMTTHTLADEIAALRNTPIDALDEQEVKMVLSATKGFNCEEGNISYHAMARLQGISFATIALLSYGYNEGWFLKPNEDNDTPFLCQQNFEVSEDDIPMLHGIPVSEVDRVEKRSLRAVQFFKNKVYVAPAAYGEYDENYIIRAWLEAVITPSTVPGKRILGWTHAKNTRVYDVLHISQERIDQIVATFDDIASRTGAFPRSDGIYFARPNRASKAVHAMITESDRPEYKRNTSALSHSRDLNYDSALRQHIAAGFPIDEPVHDPKYIKERYLKAASGMRFVEGDYPYSELNWIEDTEKQCRNAYAEGGSQISTKNLLSTKRRL